MTDSTPSLPPSLPPSFFSSRSNGSLSHLGPDASRAIWPDGDLSRGVAELSEDRVYVMMVGAGTYVFRLDDKDYGSACV